MVCQQQVLKPQESEGEKVTKDMFVWFIVNRLPDSAAFEHRLSTSGGVKPLFVEEEPVSDNSWLTLPTDNLLAATDGLCRLPLLRRAQLPNIDHFMR